MEPIGSRDNRDIVRKEVREKAFHHHSISHICYLKLVEKQHVISLGNITRYFWQWITASPYMKSKYKIDRIFGVTDGVSCGFRAWRNENRHVPSWCVRLGWSCRASPLGRSSHSQDHTRCRSPSERQMSALWWVRWRCGWSYSSSLCFSPQERRWCLNPRRTSHGRTWKNVWTNSRQRSSSLLQAPEWLPEARCWKGWSSRKSSCHKSLEGFLQPLSAIEKEKNEYLVRIVDNQTSLYKVIIMFHRPIKRCNCLLQLTTITKRNVEFVCSLSKYEVAFILWCHRHSGLDSRRKTTKRNYDCKNTLEIPYDLP